MLVSFTVLGIFYPGSEKYGNQRGRNGNTFTMQH